MHGYVAQRRGRFYAVIYEGRDPVTGNEVRRWHPACADRIEAERLAVKLAEKERRRLGAVRSLTFGAYRTSQWLPAKKLQLATSTYRGYERNAQIHILPTPGRVGLRRLRYQHIEALYNALLHPAEGRGLAPKTVYEIHLIMRGSLNDAVRRGLISRNVALVAAAPNQRCAQTTAGRSWTDDELRRFLRAAAGHRHFALFWVAAMTGMRRSEVLGLQWPDIDFRKRCLHVNRGLVSVDYEVHQSDTKTRTSRRSIDLDATTINVLQAWRDFQAARFAAVGVDHNDGCVFTDGDGNSIHPHAIQESFRRLVRKTDVPTIRFHDLRHTHGSLLIKEGVPVKVVSERLGHAHIAFTIQTYQHLLPGMQVEAARTCEHLATPVPPASSNTVEHRRNTRRNSA